MSTLVEVRMPKYPECWESCGNCGSGDILIEEILVQPGQGVEEEEVLVIIETGKVALDIPSPKKGIVKDIFVKIGDKVPERQLILTLECN